MSPGGAAAGRGPEEWGPSMQLYAWVSWVAGDEREMGGQLSRGI